MILAQTAMELKLLLRNAEQVGLTLVIPLLLLFFFNLPLLYSRWTPNAASTSWCPASWPAVGDEFGLHRSGHRHRLRAQVPGAQATRRHRPAARGALLAGKTLSVLCLEVIQVVLICGVGFALGWHPHGDPAWAVLLVVLGTFAFGGLGLLMAGTLRAEVTLAAANLVWLVLLFCGGIAIPLTKFPDGLAQVLQYLPSAALSQGLHAVLQDGDAVPVRAALTLLAWAVVSLAAAARWFRWE